MPYSLRYWASQIIAATVYFPLARLSWAVEEIGFSSKNIPLSIYRNLSFYLMRTDALDRFGTRLEHRFSYNQIKEMMLKSGLENIEFSIFSGIGTERFLVRKRYLEANEKFSEIWN